MFNVTIDGVAGCGKSTIAEYLSKRLNLKKFNTGSLYRAITCEFLHRFGRETKPTKKLMDEFVKDLDVEVEFVGEQQKVYVNHHDYNNVLREEIVSLTTPLVSGYEKLREKVREIQRKFASQNDCIMEGRDIGRVVLPNASCKLFLTASPEVRAERRYEQIKEAGEKTSFDEVLRDIKLRDKEDREREHGAMIPADDAIIVDNSGETLEETLERCERIIKEKQIK